MVAPAFKSPPNRPRQERPASSARLVRNVQHFDGVRVCRDGEPCWCWLASNGGTIERSIDGAPGGCRLARAGLATRRKVASHHEWRSGSRGLQHAHRGHTWVAAQCGPRLPPSLLGPHRTLAIFPISRPVAVVLYGVNHESSAGNERETRSFWGHIPILPLGTRCGCRFGFGVKNRAPASSPLGFLFCLPPPAIAQVTHCIVAGKTKVLWDMEVGISWWRTVVGLLQSLAWQSVLEYYWHRLVFAAVPAARVVVLTSLGRSRTQNFVLRYGEKKM